MTIRVAKLPLKKTKGRYADFVILDKDLINILERDLHTTQVLTTVSADSV